MEAKKLLTRFFRSLKQIKVKWDKKNPISRNVKLVYIEIIFF